MALGQQVILLFKQFVIEHCFLLTLLGIFCLAVYDFYNQYLRINKNTDHIDIMERYINLQLRRRYKL